jgi:phage regulator Rha-like protein
MTTHIESRILTIRNQKVILDSDLAALYSVLTKRLNEQVRRNNKRFPEDFVFKLEYQEVSALRSQFATSNRLKGGRRYLPFVFTEHGTIMAANVLNSQVAIDASILLIRTFIKMRTMLAEHAELKKRLMDIEIKLAQGFAQHEQELLEIRFIIAQFDKEVEKKKSRIGF